VSYSEKLQDPRWQKIRLQVFERDRWACQVCGDSTSTLNVHHWYYEKGRNPWEYEIDTLSTLCEGCHEFELQRGGIEKELLDTLRQEQFDTGAVYIISELIGYGKITKKEIETRYRDWIGIPIEEPVVLGNNESGTTEKSSSEAAIPLEGDALQGAAGVGPERDR